MQEVFAPSEAAAKPVSRKKTVTETYQKLSQLEHILLRPDTYIGSAQRAPQSAVHVWDTASSRIVQREVSFAPGLYKIFDEILVNAADHKQRSSSMKNIRVEIEPENCKISVWNDGTGIPVEVHEKEGVYIPELIFGHLLTSSNYDDDEKKVVGGRNGYGAKLANIFSTQFVIETADSERGKVYKQIFRDNMTVKGKPSITKSKKSNEEWTRITFYPDLPKFGMDYLDDDIVSLMMKRVYDIAGTNPSIRVSLNGTRIPIKSFKDYVGMYHEQVPAKPFVHEKCGERWEIAVGESQGQLEQVSFVNSIWTIKGGAHVSHVVDQIVLKLQEYVAKKNKGMKIKPHQIKCHLSVFVNALIENPAFDSQTKETLTTKPSQFGSKCVISDDAFKKILKSGIVDTITSFAIFKQSKELEKTDGGKKGRVTGIEKLDDANKAGGRDASKCTLILTEGDSAKALAVSGLSVIGRDFYGVFPLRGKLLNVREASHAQMMKNKEITNLKKILGLQQGKKYADGDIRSLRYGHVLIMTDQDHDGSHIKGLLINFFNHFWPALLQIDGFLQEFITPIVKCTKGKSEKVFFTIPEYREWMESAGSGWKFKYYKGLGSSGPGEAKIYFANLCRHLHTYRWSGESDGKMIELAFAKSRVNDRKQWLMDYQPGTYLDHRFDELNYSNFINKELILFSVADNARSIPSVIDGLKPSQRKVLFGCFKRNLKSEIKVGQLSGYISEQAAYHHGDVSLQATIVGLAQNFVGSNNLNLLYPAGQFGTRLQGGKDAASARYISTKLAPVARALFPEADDPLLTYLEDDGFRIEPMWYCPIIPTVLVNGADGIGTGWSTQVPCYNPRDLIRNVRRMLAGEEPLELEPWYRGFRGSIVPVTDSQSYDVYGTVLRGQSSNEFRVRELPIRSWTTPFKDFIETQLVNSSESGKGNFIKDFTDQSTENSVSFDITVTAEAAKEQENGNTIYKKLKLTGSVTTSNMMLFDAEGRMAKYGDTSAIFKEFFTVRMDLYEKRRMYLLHELQAELECLDNKQRFILAVVDGKLKVAKRKKAAIIADLDKNGYKRIAKSGRQGGKGHSLPLSPDDESSDANGSDSEQTGSASMSESEKGFDYLLSMPLWSLTLERVQSLLAQRNQKAALRDEMERTIPSDLWLHDLDNLEQVLVDDENRAAEEAVGLAKAARDARHARAGAQGRVRKKTKAVKYEEDDEDDTIDTTSMIAPPSTRKDRARVARRPRETTMKANPDETKQGRSKEGAKQGKTKSSVALQEFDSESEDDVEELDLLSDGDSAELIDSCDDLSGQSDAEMEPEPSKSTLPAVAGGRRKRSVRAPAPEPIVEEDKPQSTPVEEPETKRETLPKKAPIVVDSSSSSSDDEDQRSKLSLAERLALRGRQAASSSKSGLVTSAKHAEPGNASKRPRNTQVQKPDPVPASPVDLDVMSPSPAQKKKRSRIYSPPGRNRRKPAVRKAQSRKPLKAVSDSSGDDEEAMIADAVANPDVDVVSTTPTKPDSGSEAKELQDIGSNEMSSDEEIEATENAARKPKSSAATKPKTCATTKPKTSTAISSRSGRPVKGHTTQAKKVSTSRNRVAASKKVSSEGGESPEAEEEPVVQPVKAPARPRRAPTRKPIIEISSDEGEDSASDFEADDDDSDFE